MMKNVGRGEIMGVGSWHYRGNVLNLCIDKYIKNKEIQLIYKFTNKEE